MRYAYCIAFGCKCEHRFGVPAEQVGEGREDYRYEHVGPSFAAVEAAERADVLMPYGPRPTGDDSDE